MAKSLSVNKSDLKTIRNLFLLLLVSLYVYFNYLHPCSKRLVFLLVTTILTFYLFNDIYCAILLSIVLSVAFTLICHKNDVIEGMVDEKPDEKKIKEGLTVQDINSIPTKKDRHKADTLKPDTTTTDNSSDERFSDNFIDYNETMRNNLKNLDVKNIEKMTNETKDLLNTQKELMKTMAEMTPLLKKGMGMVEMFKKKKD
tara:strand:+ start:238 stop:837 length:600 start_codon:yes stop_codon:yes gene_type:complete